MKALTHQVLHDIPPLPWNEVQARAVIDLLDQSSQPASTFARRHGINVHVLYSWRRRLNARRTKPVSRETTPRFVPVRVVGAEETPFATDGNLEVLHPAGCIVRINGPVDVRQLTDVLQSLGQARC